MITNEAKPIQISIAEIFKNVIYVVPIYQRNYSWRAKQIEQLIDDINSAPNNYYLGTLITNQKENGIYEVIDGQQRLTTLYLLKLYLSNKNDVFKEQPLQFEARDKYRNTLHSIRSGNITNDDFVASELYDGYRVIKVYFENNALKPDNFKEKLKQVYLVRVQVPKNIDLNHYFEIMNTRGEQLELHQIVKAKILERLKTKDKNIAADIWDCCADMDSYVQMNFDKKVRNSLFTNDWSDLKDSVNNWEMLKESFSYENLKEEELQTLKEILEEHKNSNGPKNENKDDNERFESVISFPNFLLQVNAVINIINNKDFSLDDKNLIENLKNNWENEENSKIFILRMLQCRALFDKYILKREYIKEYQKEGKWSLKKLVKYKQKDNAEKPLYKATYSIDDTEEDDNITKRLRTLESALRITYTSPKTMDWIAIVLKNLLENKKTDLINLLEQYCQKRIKKSDYKNKSGFNIERIVFSYLDYLLFRDNYKNIVDKDWEFQFRNSIEHFYPQNPDNGEYWGGKDLDSFGNLALITVSGNSKFSNLPPSAKIDYKDIIKQSLKLIVMESIVNNENKQWTQELAEKHKKDMQEIIDNNGVKNNKLVI